MKHMSPRLLKIATDLAAAPLAIPSGWTKEDCQEAVRRIDLLVHALVAHAEVIEEETGKPCFKTGDIIMTLIDQMTDIEEEMKTR